MNTPLKFIPVLRYDIETVLRLLKEANDFTYWNILLGFTQADQNCACSDKNSRF